MTKDSFRDLIRGWSASKESPPDEGAPQQPEVVAAAPLAPVEAPPIVGVTSGRSPTVSGASTVASIAQSPQIAVQPGSEIAALQQRSVPPKGRALTDDELKMLSLLGPLIQTPRDAKRLLNLYRMLRSTRSLSSADDFLGGNEYRRSPYCSAC
jgi:hypothetical protein